MAASIDLTKVLRALLCGWRVRRASARACSDGLGHARLALEPCRLRGVDGSGRDVRDEVCDGAADHAGLAQRGKHLIDVMQERGARPDHQHA